MSSVQTHLRKTFLAGVFAAMPIAVTGFVVWYVDSKTRVIAQKLFGANVPFLGVLVAVVAIYLLGVAVTSLLGRFFLRTADRLLARVPLLKPVYQTWKQVVLTPGEGIFARVVLVADETGRMDMLGFTSGIPTAGDRLCVFVPAAPNPTNGRLYFVRREHCRLLDLSSEEAFKLILSGGSYVPAGLP
jgi:uncharacterized membrane protein